MRRNDPRFAGGKRLVWMLLVIVTSFLLLSMRRLSGGSEFSLGSSRADIDNDIIQVLGLIDSNQDELIKWLSDAVRIQSVSVGEMRNNSGLESAREFYVNLAKRVGLDEIKIAGSNPGTVLAKRRGQASKPVLVYVHWDVQPAVDGQGGWAHDPFDVQAQGDRLYGRGVSDDKAAAIGWLWVIEQFNKAGVPLSVDIRIMAEGEEEIGSPQLKQVVDMESLEGGFLSGVKYMMVSDGSFVSDRPCVVQGTRGVVHFYVSVSGAPRDLHSGTFGGGVYEPLSEMSSLMASLSDGKGTVMVEGFKEIKYPRIDSEELKQFGLDVSEWERLAGTEKATTRVPEALLERVWGSPSVSVHGIGSSADFEAAAISGSASAHFSIRIPAGMNPDEVAETTVRHLKSKFEAFKTPNKLQISVTQKAPGFAVQSGSQLHAAISRAVKRARHVEPENARLGGAIPVAAFLSTANPESEVLVLPIGGRTDNAHGHESISRQDLHYGTRTFALILDELSRL